MNSRPYVSVIMPARNAAGTITQQLEALLHQRIDFPFEIIIIDDASDDETARMVTKRCKASDAVPVTLVKLRRHKGLNTARNVGISFATAPFIAGCDADDVADRHWLAQIVRPLELGADAVGGYCRINDSDRRRFGAGLRFAPRSDSLPTALGYMPFALGANYAVTKQVWAALEGFDPAFQQGNADVEFFWRLQQKDYVLWFAPHAVMHYKYRNSSLGAVRQLLRVAVEDVHLHKVFQLREADSVRRSVWMELFWTFRQASSNLRTLKGLGRLARPIIVAAGRGYGSVRYRHIFL